MKIPASTLQSEASTQAGAAGAAEPTVLPAQLRPATLAAGRLFGVNVLLGALGLASAGFVISRLFAAWQVKGGADTHTISLFGQRLSYPVANADAIVVTALAGLGLVMLGAAARSLARELLAERRFRRILAARSPLPLGGAWVFTDEEPQAFCAGLLRPRIYLSTATMELLDATALAAVLAHERHHVIRHDPLRLACGRALLAGLFFVPSLRRLIERQQALAEIGADEAALLSAGVDRAALASAMLSFSEGTSTDAAGVDPQRIDYLLGEPAAWRFPLLLCIGTAAALLLLTATALLAGQVAAGTATLAPPGLSSQPCIAILALIPAGAGIAGLAFARSRRARPAALPETR
jgi:Zn-dependent protease with chaperone function